MGRSSSERRAEEEGVGRAGGAGAAAGRWTSPLFLERAFSHFEFTMYISDRSY
jgi:hypothetical protein